MNMLTLKNVNKSFGSHHIINELSLNVPEHSIYGFIGENGAGKTTTMKMILGLYSIDSGEILVNGEHVCYGQNITNRYIGYLPDVPEFYGYMKPPEYLMLCGQITGMKDAVLKSRIPEMLDMVGLSGANKKIHGFSRGMKQRLGIAQAMINKPKLLICDEPTSALDPVGRKEIIDILKAACEQTTVIFSTHILSDVERICDEIGLLHGGKLVVQGKLDEICGVKSNSGFIIEFMTPKDVHKFNSIYNGGQLIASGSQLLYKGRSRADMAEAMRLLCDNSIYPIRVEMCEPTLESLFMEVVGQ